MITFTRRWVPILCAIVCLIAILSFWSEEDSGDATIPDEHPSATIPLSSEQIEATQLSIQPVQSRQIPLKTAFPSLISFNADRFAHVVTDVVGIARDVRKNLGDLVQTGEVLAVLDSRDMAEAKAHYLAARRYEELAQTTLAREQSLSQKKIAAEAEVISAKHDFDKATIDRQLAEQKLLALGLKSDTIKKLVSTQEVDLRLYELYAPLDGTVVERDIVQGELLQAGSTPYAIADLNTVWVEMYIHPKDMEKVHMGQALQVIHPVSGQLGKARIIYISPMIDRETRTGQVIAELDNPNREWRPGTFVQSEVVIDLVEANIAIPKESLQRVDGTDVVFVQTPDGLQMRGVEIGASDDRYVEIISGLTSEDCCATQNTFVLKSEILKGSGEE